MNFLITFITGFVTKFFTTFTIEKIVIIFLKALVDRTDSDVDNKIFNAVFGSVSKKEDE